MSKHTDDTMTTAALHDLDPAPSTALSEAERERADATFARIVATPSDGQVPVEPGRQRRRWRRALVPVGLVGAAGAAIPVLLLGGGSAYGSWTPTPQPLTPEGTSAAAARCRASIEMPDKGEQVLIAERRGEWTYVLLAGPKAEAKCLMPNDADREGTSSGYDTGPTEAPTLARGRIGGIEFTDTDTAAGGWITWITGYAGSDVTGITVHTPLDFDVEASVDHGRFSAWWPRPKPGDDPDAGGPWSYTLTLSDGSTRRGTG